MSKPTTVRVCTSLNPPCDQSTNQIEESKEVNSSPPQAFKPYSIQRDYTASVCLTEKDIDIQRPSCQIHSHIPLLSLHQLEARAPFLTTLDYYGFDCYRVIPSGFPKGITFERKILDHECYHKDRSILNRETIDSKWNKRTYQCYVQAKRWATLTYNPTMYNLSSNKKHDDKDRDLEKKIQGRTTIQYVRKSGTKTNNQEQNKSSKMSRPKPQSGTQQTGPHTNIVKQCSNRLSDEQMDAIEETFGVESGNYMININAEYVMFVPDVHGSNCLGQCLILAYLTRIGKPLNHHILETDLVEYFIRHNKLSVDFVKDVVDTYLKQKDFTIHDALKYFHDELNNIHHQSTNQETLRQLRVSKNHPLTRNETTMIWFSNEQQDLIHVCLVLPRHSKLCGPLNGEALTANYTTTQTNNILQKPWLPKSVKYTSRCLIDSLMHYSKSVVDAVEEAEAACRDVFYSPFCNADISAVNDMLQLDGVYFIHTIGYFSTRGELVYPCSKLLPTPKLFITSSDDNPQALHHLFTFAEPGHFTPFTEAHIPLMLEFAQMHAYTYIQMKMNNLPAYKMTPTCSTLCLYDPKLPVKDHVYKLKTLEQIENRQIPLSSTEEYKEKKAWIVELASSAGPYTIDIQQREILTYNFRLHFRPQQWDCVKATYPASLTTDRGTFKQWYGNTLLLFHLRNAFIHANMIKPTEIDPRCEALLNDRFFPRDYKDFTMSLYGAKGDFNIWIIANKDRLVVYDKQGSFITTNSHVNCYDIQGRLREDSEHLKGVQCFDQYGAINNSCPYDLKSTNNRVLFIDGAGIKVRCYLGSNIEALGRIIYQGQLGFDVTVICTSTEPGLQISALQQPHADILLNAISKYYTVDKNYVKPYTDGYGDRVASGALYNAQQVMLVENQAFISANVETQHQTLSSIDAATALNNKFLNRDFKDLSTYLEKRLSRPDRVPVLLQSKTSSTYTYSLRRDMFYYNMCSIRILLLVICYIYPFGAERILKKYRKFIAAYNEYVRIQSNKCKFIDVTMAMIKGTGYSSIFKAWIASTVFRGTFVVALCFFGTSLSFWFSYTDFYTYINIIMWCLIGYNGSTIAYMPWGSKINVALRSSSADIRNCVLAYKIFLIWVTRYASIFFSIFGVNVLVFYNPFTYKAIIEKFLQFEFIKYQFVLNCQAHRHNTLEQYTYCVDTVLKYETISMFYPIWISIILVCVVSCLILYYTKWYKYLNLFEKATKQVIRGVYSFKNNYDQYNLDRAHQLNQQDIGLKIQAPQIRADTIQFNDNVEFCTMDKFGIPGNFDSYNPDGYQLRNLWPIKHQEHYNIKQQMMDYKNVLCLIQALLMRHGKTKLKPDLNMLKQFKQNTNNWINKLLHREHQVKQVLLRQDLPSHAEYVQQIEGNQQKKATYLQGMEEFNRKLYIPNNYVVMAKPEECVFKSGNPESINLRPRLIFNPNRIVKSLLGWYNFCMIKVLKQIIPGFIQGYNCEELEDIILRKYRTFKKPYLMSYDGASHDSHQHEELLKIVDNQFHKTFGQMVLDKMPGMWSRMREAITEAACRTKLNGFYYYKGKCRRMGMRIKLNGTVASGNATATTLGNTYRVLSYLNFISNGRSYYPFVSGDDVLCIIEQDDIQAWTNSIGAVYNSEDYVGPYGLGLAIKDLKFSPTSIDFLSKQGYVSHESILIHRKYDRIVTGGNVTSNQSLTDEEYRCVNTLAIASYREWNILSEYIDARLSEREYASEAARITLKSQLRYKVARQVPITKEQWELAMCKMNIPPCCYDGLGTALYAREIQEVKYIKGIQKVQCFDGNIAIPTKSSCGKSDNSPKQWIIMGEPQQSLCHSVVKRILCQEPTSAQQTECTANALKDRKGQHITCQVLSRLRQDTPLRKTRNSEAPYQTLSLDASRLTASGINPVPSHDGLKNTEGEQKCIARSYYRLVQDTVIKVHYHNNRTQMSKRFSRKFSR